MTRLSPKYISLIIVSQCGEMLAPSEWPVPGSGPVPGREKWNSRDGSGLALHHPVPVNHVAHVMLFSSMFGDISELAGLT